MRRVLVLRVGVFFLLAGVTAIGCGGSTDKKAVTPNKTYELPKEGPAPAGGPAQPGNKNAAAD